MGIVEVTLFFLHSALNIPLHKGVRKLLLSSAELDRSCWFRHTLEYGSSPRNTAPPPGIRLHPQEYGSYGSSHRYMAPPTGIWLLPQEYGSSHRNMAPPAGIRLRPQENGSSHRNMAPMAPPTGIWAPATGIWCFLHKFVVVVQLLSHVWLFATLWTTVCQAPWGSPGKDTGVGCHFLLQGSSQTRDWTRLLHWQMDSLPLSHQGIPAGTELFLLLRARLWLCWQTVLAFH